MPSGRVRARLLPALRPGELRGAAWSFLYFFFVLNAYYILRPIREARGVGVGVQWFTALYAASLVALLAVTPLWGALVARVPRARLLTWSYRFFALVLVGFFVVFRQSTHWAPAAGFFVWMSTFNLLAVAIFWAFMTDVWPTEAGKRLFGWIAAGGSAGAVLGPTVTVTLVTYTGTEALLLVAAALLEAAVFCAGRVSSWARTRSPADPAVPAGNNAHETPGKPEQTVGGGIWAGLTELVRAPFLAAAAGFTLLATLSATFNNLLQARLVSARGLGQVGMTQVFAGIDLVTNVLTVVLQALVLAPLLARFGVWPALAALPLISGAGFGATAVAPVLLVAATMTALRRSTAYGLVTPTFSVLFTQASREQKYKARAAIDTVIFRTGDLVGSLAFSGLLALGLGLRGTAAVSATVAIPWLILAWWLKRNSAVGHR
jgi:AAA family ATP:ADP antiporter